MVAPWTAGGIGFDQSRWRNKAILMTRPDGQTYTVTIRYVTMEGIIKPWIGVTSFSTPRQVPVPPAVQPPAFLRWGKPSEFNTDDSFRNAAMSPGFTAHTPDDPDDSSLKYDEHVRLTSDLRVENPDDPSQYVIVQRIEHIDFNGPNKTRIQLNFNNPS